VEQRREGAWYEAEEQATQRGEGEVRFCPLPGDFGYIVNYKGFKTRAKVLKTGFIKSQTNCCFGIKNR
jgi:hypothetical protein